MLMDKCYQCSRRNRGGKSLANLVVSSTQMAWEMTKADNDVNNQNGLTTSKFFSRGDMF